MWSFFSRDPAKDFHYDIGEKITGLENKSIWTLHHGKKKVLANQSISFVLSSHRYIE
jgi:SCY1-like protein 1